MIIMIYMGSFDMIQVLQLRMFPSRVNSPCGAVSPGGKSARYTEPAAPIYGYGVKQSVKTWEISTNTLFHTPGGK